MCKNCVKMCKKEPVNNLPSAGGLDHGTRRQTAVNMDQEG